MIKVIDHTCLFSFSFGKRNNYSGDTIRLSKGNPRENQNL